MIKSRVILVLFVLALITAACGGVTPTISNTLQGSGVVKIETRDVSGGFTAVEVYGSGELMVTVGDMDALTLEAEDNILPLLTSNVTGGKLVLATKPNSSYSATKPVIFRLTVKDLRSLAALDATTATFDSLTAPSFSLTVGGSATINLGALTVSDQFEARATESGKVTINRVDSSSLTLNADNSSTVTIRALAAQTLTAVLNRSASVTLAGKVTTQDITAKSSSVYQAKDLDSQAVTANADGSSRITVSVSGLLNATAASSSAITYYGAPEVQPKTSESGTIRQG